MRDRKLSSRTAGGGRPGKALAGAGLALASSRGQASPPREPRYQPALSHPKSR